MEKRDLDWKQIKEYSNVIYEGLHRFFQDMRQFSNESRPKKLNLFELWLCFRDIRLISNLY